MFCSKCGQQVVAGAEFCQSCGKKVAPPPSDTEGAPNGFAPSPTPSSSPPPPSTGAANGSPGPGAGDPANSAKVVVEGLKRLYKAKVKPLEEMYKFPLFSSPSFTDTDFDSKPLVLCIGQYSTGKTTFIKYLLERDFPGLRIGPEPTTDRFVAVMYGHNERVIPGNAVAVQQDKPFTALQKYGMNFLNKFECAELPAPILESLTFIDTPGVLAGNEQTKGRTYNFAEVIEWFAERSDRILLLFDAHKLDISDELKEAIMALRGHDDKIRCILNKADMVNNQQLMRVYGALMWSLGKVVRTPEVLRVYIGSFWDRPFQNDENKALFEAEQDDLLADLRSLPRHSAVRKINELVKRARTAKVHALILDHLRGEFGFFGKEKKKRQLLENLGQEFRKIQLKHNLPTGDFPNLKRFTEILERCEIHKFPKLNPKMIDAMDEVLGRDIPRLLKQIPNYKKLQSAATGNAENPFDQDSEAKVDQANVPSGGDLRQQAWIITGALKSKYDNYFFRLSGGQEKISGATARPIMLESGLSDAQLWKIWQLGDIDSDGHLDPEEFAVVMYLVDETKAGKELPEKLPPELIPPSRRRAGIF